MSTIFVTVLPGYTDYNDGLNLQRRLLTLRQQNKIKDVLLLLEHPPILTLGKNADTHHILFPAEVLKSQGIEIHRSDRGGDVTYHGPGQIVGYPIINVRENSLKLKKYIWLLEQVFLDLLDGEYGLKAYREPDYRGVWINDSKILSIGCSVKQGVTMHGFSFNVNTNLEHFKTINPCGITNKGVTSLKTILGYDLEVDVVNELIIKYFCKCFNKQPQLTHINSWSK